MHPTSNWMIVNSYQDKEDEILAAFTHSTTLATQNSLSFEYDDRGSGGGGVINLSSDANKVFDDVVFDLLKVDPDEISGQLTLIDLPLFKAIEPDELISCKWISREKLIKAPNIVKFTRRFNQTTFWCQKEILNCKRIERRGKMITHFIKICKRLNELHSFNSLMAIIVALKSASIFRLKKTWSQHVAKRDVATFERLADLMFDTGENKRKIRDMHSNCKLPCIPFLGLFLTDLIYIDIAHPHNSFDNPQRRNQMNNICRIISEYQQSNYQDFSSFSCSCCFQTSCNPIVSPHHNKTMNPVVAQNDSISNCVTPNCNCAIHHGHGYGGGIINNDGTIYISEVTYVKNYLNSFLYIEELQKFKEDENYKDSLELEPDIVNTGSNDSNSNSQNNKQNYNEPNASAISPGKIVSTSNLTNEIKRFNKNGMNSYQSTVDATKTGSVFNSLNQKQRQQLKYPQQHRKTLSLVPTLFINNSSNQITETKESTIDLKVKNPLDDSIVESQPPSVTSLIATTNNNDSNSNPNPQLNTSNSSTTTVAATKTTIAVSTDLPQKQVITTAKVNDHSSLLKELLKHRYNTAVQNSSITSSSSLSSSSQQTSIKQTTNIRSSHHHYHNKFNCYSSSSVDVDDESDDYETTANLTDDLTNAIANSNEDSSIDDTSIIIQSSKTKQKTPNRLFNLSTNSAPESSGSGTSNTRCKNKISSASSSSLSKTLILKNKNFNSTLKSNQSNDSNSQLTVKQINNSIGATSGNNRRLSGRNLLKSLNEEKNQVDYLDSSTTSTKSQSINDETCTKIVCTKDSSKQIVESSIKINEINKKEMTNLNNLLAIEQQPIKLIMFESSVKRKCIIKNFHKPRFSKWKSYWLQLIVGNFLIYYPAKSVFFNRDNKKINIEQNYSIDDFYSTSTSTSSTSSSTFVVGSSSSTSNCSNSTTNSNQQLFLQQLKNQLIHKKVNYNKNPSKMHPISNWMVVNLFEDKENEIIAATAVCTPSAAAVAAKTQSKSTSSQQQVSVPTHHHSKFDIQLNDLNNGNMYKFRFDSLQLAKQWLEQFKLACKNNESQKSDNLIRFD